MVIRKNRMDDFVPEPVEAGSETKEEFQAVYTPDGGKVLKKVGEFNLYKFIQSFADEVDVNRIVNAAVSMQDPSLLQRSKGVFADVSGLPSDMASQRDIYDAIIGKYNSLGGDEKFGSIEDYFKNNLSADNFIQNDTSVSSSVDSASVKEGGKENE